MAKSKILVGVLVAMLSLAFGGSSASAKYDSQAEVTTLVGEGTNWLLFESKFGKVECSTTSLTGTQTGTAVGGGVYTSNHLTVHPQFTGCKALGFNASVDTTGCDFTFTSPTKTETTGPHAQVDIVPTSGGSCDINVVAAGGLCSVNIPNQTEAGPAAFMNEGSGKESRYAVAWLTTELDYTGVGGFCSGSGTNGVFSGDVTIEGEAGGDQVGVWATNT